MIDNLMAAFSVNSIATSILWMAISILIYASARHLQSLAKQSPLLNPLAVTTVFICLLLVSLDVDVADYRSYVSPLDLLLGPATVALAVPLYRQAPILIALGWKVVTPIAFAGVIAPAIAWAIAFALDAPLDLQMTVLVKSITTPLAMQTTSILGGAPNLAAIIVILTGIVGGVTGPIIFVVLKTQSDFSKGIALGSVSHVVGTAQAFSINERCGAFATLALCLNGVLTSFLLPVLV